MCLGTKETRGDAESKASISTGTGPAPDTKAKAGAKSSARRPGRGSKVEHASKPGPAVVRSATPPPKHARTSPAVNPKKNLADEFAKAAKKTPDTLLASPPIKSPDAKKARVTDDHESTEP